jgi:hypothetical protein
VKEDRTDNSKSSINFQKINKRMALKDTPMRKIDHKREKAEELVKQ